MKQKFSLSIVQGAGLNIKEFAELEQDDLSLLCDETYGSDTVAAALAEGPRAVIRMLRTPHFFPNRACAEQLAEAVIRLFGDPPTDPIDILVDEAEGLVGKRRPASKPVVPVDDDEDTGIDDLLDDDVDDVDEALDDEFEDDLNIESLNNSIKIADDPSADLSDDA